MTNPLPPAVLASVQDALRRGQKIEAIKIHREHSGLGLKEAKDAVEMLEKEMGPPTLQTRQGPKSEKGCLGLILLLLGLLATGSWCLSILV